MPLGCSCDFDLEPGQLTCYPDDDFSRLNASKRKRCQSCKKLINIGDYVVRFNIAKIPEHEVECNIYGEDGEVPKADRYLCEQCGEIYFNLQSIGFECIWVGEDMMELLKDYHSDYDPPKLTANAG
jgi:hypothetical protein